MSTGACIHATVPDTDQMARTAAALQGALPALQDLHVEGVRTQDWCQFIDYPRGAFTNIVDRDSTCNLFTKPPGPFDDTATADYDRVKAALEATGVSIQIVWNVEYDASGQITTAEFDVTAGMYDRFSYRYDRNNTLSLEPNPDTIVIEQVNDQWWFLSEDWN